jgi:hypothetical protein
MATADLTSVPVSRTWCSRVRLRVAYYAGVYAYDNPALHPNFPTNDVEFMSMWAKVNLAEWEAGPGLSCAKEHTDSADSKGKTIAHCGRRATQLLLDTVNLWRSPLTV